MTLKDITPEALAQVSTTIAMGRLGQPEEISKMFIFLASDESSYCTGGLYHVDGWTTG
jgi:3alpha(or 20beta)-hydroxysteroid dehydrogenase